MKLIKIQRTVTLAKFLKVQRLGACQMISCKVKEICCIWPLRKWHITQWWFGFWSTIYIIWACYSEPFIEWSKNLPVWSEAQNKRRLCNRSRLPWELLCHLGRMVQQIQWYLMYIGMLFKAFGRTLSQYISWEFWNKAMLFSGDNFSFKKQLFDYYRSLVETDHLTMDHQLTMWFELPIMNCMWFMNCLVPNQTVNLGVCNYTPSSNGASTYKILSKKFLKAQVSYMNPDACCPYCP